MNAMDWAQRTGGARVVKVAGSSGESFAECWRRPSRDPTKRLARRGTGQLPSALVTEAQIRERFKKLMGKRDPAARAERARLVARLRSLWRRS